MNNKFVFKAVIAAVLVICFASCDKDFDQIGSGVVGEDHFTFDKDTSATVIAYNHLTGPVQTNNLPINQLGYIENPVYGNTTANFVGQLQLPSASLAPTFGANIVIDSVYFTLPYFSHKDTDVATTSEGAVTYVLDSLNRIETNAKFDLSIYENGYYLNDFDPATGFEQSQRFYNTQGNDFDQIKRGVGTGGVSVLNGTRLNDSAALLNHWPQNDGFVIDSTEIRTTVGEGDDKTVTRSAPGMRIRLNDAYFMKKIFNAPADKLANNAAFEDYFRGLYFKVTNPDAGKTNLAQLNFAKGVITIYYREDKTGSTEKVSKTYAINLQGNTVNLLNNSANAPYLSQIPATPNSATGDSRIYLKGGQGSTAFIDLFGGPGELAQLKANKWLINEANLTFYVDSLSTQLDRSLLAQRIYLYDATNNKVLYDYSVDVTTTTNAKRNKYTFGGILDTVTDAKGRVKCKLRITNHIRRIIRDGEPNVKLGLVVTESIAETGFAAYQTPFNVVAPGFDDLWVKALPVAAVMSPLGIVFYGNNIPAAGATPAEKIAYRDRLKLEIYYTQY